MAEFQPGTTFAGHRIDAVVGRGGMGIVYRATHLALERSVALKVMSPDLVRERGFRERFKRESRVAASLDHPHVVPVLHAGEEDGVLYITMRLIDGDDLRAVLHEEGRFEPERAARLTAQVASALDAAHGRGLVHRDVKPANVLRTWHAGGEHVYLTDFGQTKVEQSTADLTNSGEWVGTLDYISPEQIRGERVDARTDVYALGCMLYQELSGHVPFPAENFAAKVWAHLNTEPADLTQEQALPRGLNDVIARAMAKDPQDRYPSAGALARAVNEAVAADGQTRVRRRPADLEAERTPPAQPTLPSAPQADTQRSRRRVPGRWPVRIAILVLLVAAALVGLLLGRGCEDPVYRDDVIALFDLYQANLTNENLTGLEQLLSSGFTRAVLADPPVDRAAALAQYRRSFESTRQPRVSLRRMAIDTASGRATVRAQFLRTTPGRLFLGDAGSIVITMVESDGQLLIDSIHNYPDVVVSPPRLPESDLPATVEVDATTEVRGRRVRVAGGTNRLRANTDAVAFPLTPEARRVLRTEQPIDVRMITRPAGGREPTRDRYTTAFAR